MTFTWTRHCLSTSNVDVDVLGHPLLPCYNFLSHLTHTKGLNVDLCITKVFNVSSGSDFPPEFRTCQQPTGPFT